MDGYLGEIRMFAGNFAPENWALCNGALLAIQDNQALFSILGTKYGGDGVTNFALPDLRGRLAVHAGQGAGMPTAHPIGQQFGTETVTLTEPMLPGHSHGWETYPQPSTTEAPAGQMLATNVPSSAAPTFAGIYRTTAPTSANVGPMAPQAIGSTGLGGAHANVMPGLVISFIIALQGNYPTRP